MSFLSLSLLYLASLPLLVALLLDPSLHSYSWPINAISDLRINDDTWEIDWNGKVQRCLMSDISISVEPP